MQSQYEKYKDSSVVKIITACFNGDNRGYSYLCDFPVQVGDTVIASMRGGEMKFLSVASVKEASHIDPKPSFGKYAWVCGHVKKDAVNEYMVKDNDLVVAKSQPFGGSIPTKEESKGAPKDDVQSKMDSIFGSMSQDVITF